MEGLGSVTTTLLRTHDSGAHTNATVRLVRRMSMAKSIAMKLTSGMQVSDRALGALVLGPYTLEKHSWVMATPAIQLLRVDLSMTSQLTSVQ